MTDNQQAQQPPVKETPQAPMPSAEPKTTEPSAAPQAVVPSREAPATETEEVGLPQGVKERTTLEFEKLRSELREERQKRKSVEDAFRTLQPTPAPPTITPMYDPTTGLLNEQVFSETQRAAQEAKQRAERAEERVRAYEDKLEAEAAYTAHPESNPKAKEFDEELKNVVAGVITRSMLHPDEFGGKQLDLKSGYDYVKAKFSPTVKKELEQAKKEGAQQAIEQLTPKEQASLEAVGSPSARQEVSSDIDILRRQSRHGGNQGLNALASRMAALRTQK